MGDAPRIEKRGVWCGREPPPETAGTVYGGVGAEAAAEDEDEGQEGRGRERGQGEVMVGEERPREGRLSRLRQLLSSANTSEEMADG